MDPATAATAITVAGLLKDWRSSKVCREHSAVLPAPECKRGLMCLNCGGEVSKFDSLPSRVTNASGIPAVSPALDPLKQTCFSHRGIDAVLGMGHPSEVPPGIIISSAVTVIYNLGINTGDHLEYGAVRPKAQFFPSECQTPNMVAVFVAGCKSPLPGEAIVETDVGRVARKMTAGSLLPN